MMQRRQRSLSYCSEHTQDDYTGGSSQDYVEIQNEALLTEAIANLDYKIPTDNQMFVTQGNFTAGNAVRAIANKSKGI
jgi:hypothetical protein